jgi:hypothetical protein
MNSKYHYTKNNSLRTIRLVTAVLTALLVSGARWVPIEYVQAVQGDLDPTFGGNGKVITNFSFGDSAANAVAIQPDGKIVATGVFPLRVNLSGVPFPSDFALVRYNLDGGLDSGFGTGGEVTTSFAGQTDAAKAIALLGLVYDGLVDLAGDGKSDLCHQSRSRLCGVGCVKRQSA